MNIEEFINSIEGISIDPNLISKIENAYDVCLTDYLRKLLSYDEKGLFFGDNKRLLSLSEIINADEDLHVDFKLMKRVPLFDTGDNDFIIYSFEDDMWELFNIVDKCAFCQSSDLKELLLM